MKAKIFKIQTFKLITFLPLHRISLQYFATCSAGYISSGVLVHVHLYIPAPPQQSFIQGSSAPRSNHWVTLLYTIFGRKGTLFVYMYLNLLTNATPFTYLVWNFVSLSTAVNVLSLKNEQTKKQESFFDFLTAIYKMHLLALSSLFTHRNSSTLSSYTSSSEACKRYPFRALSRGGLKCNKWP